MSKDYPSNLTRAQYDFLSDLIPEPKTGGHPRSVGMWEILNAIFYILVEGIRWRSLPGDFPLVQGYIPTFAICTKMALGCKSVTACTSGAALNTTAIPIHPKRSVIVKRQ